MVEQVKTCRSCRRPIRWVLTRRGSRMPLDSAPSPTGNVLLIDTDADARRYGTQVGRSVTLNASEAAAARLRGVDLYASHFATCPHAQRHRGKR